MRLFALLSRTRRRPPFSRPSSTLAPMSVAADQKAYRLPTNVKPLHYDLTIQTDLAAKSFTGFGSVTLRVDQLPLTSLVFNANKALELRDIAVHTTALKTDSAYRVPADKVSRDDKDERVTLDLADAGLAGAGLKQGDEITLSLGWKSALGESMVGYYISSFTTADGKPDSYTLTQFESTDARKAFPCWDEPALKATYSLSMVSRTPLVNLSNMPVYDERPYTGTAAAWDEGKTALKTEFKTEGAKTTGKTVGKLLKTIKTELKTTSADEADQGWKVTRFEKTPLMSTYLLTFASGPFEHRADTFTSSNGKAIPIRLYATKDIIHQVDYALEVTKLAVPVYEELFDIPFALPKLDSLVATDFDAGAMEGWGLITGRTSVLLWDEQSGLAAKKRVATVQSHEIAHQWFGDLVTMEWWEQLWLNEAFATLCGEVIIPDRLFPEWKVRQSFITDHLFRALELDAKRSSHPIEVDCPDANKINEIFDAISYSKGASVLRMLSEIVGEEAFLRGVSIYLKRKMYANGVTEDLLDGISEASGRDVKEIARNWTQKVGFPVVSATAAADGKVTVRQDRFLATGDVKDEENQTLWHIPLGLLTVGKDGTTTVDKSTILSDKQVELPLDAGALWKLNAGTTGVFRVAYDAEHLDALGREASKKNSALSPEDRVGLVSDAFTLARAGYSSTAGLLSLISHFKNEETKVVWTSVAEALTELSSVWWEQPAATKQSLTALQKSVFAPLADRLGFAFPAGEEPDIKELRALAFWNAGVAGHRPVVDFALEQFDLFVAGKDVEPDLQRSIFRLAVIHRGQAAYEQVLAVYRKAANPSQKINAIAALTRAEDPALIDQTLAMIATPDVKDQDVLIFLGALSANAGARRALSAWFKTEYAALFKRFETTMTMPRLVLYALSDLSSQKDYDDMTTFFADKDTGRYAMALAQGLEAIQARAKWVERDAAPVEAWLKDNKF